MKLKIVTWNINGYRAIAGQNPKRKYDKVIKENKLAEYIEQEKPDILCMQETKASLEQINEDLRYPEGYFGYYHSCSVKKGYSGVVTFTKNKPVKVNDKIGIERFDGEGRIIETDFDDFVLFNVYFPKGYTDDPRLDYKMDFYDAFFEYAGKKKKEGRKIIVCGDYNTAHTEIDLARPKENVNTSGFLQIERDKLDWLLKEGYIDAYREFIKEGGNYTWWSQRGRARENNVGWRIDYHFITENMLPHLKNAYQQPDAEGSDHCPVVLEIDV